MVLFYTCIKGLYDAITSTVGMKTPFGRDVTRYLSCILIISVTGRL